VLSTRWRRSSFSQEGQCVELSSAWRISSYSDTVSCVELATAPGHVGVRDSKQPAGGQLTLPDAARTQLVAFAVRRGPVTG
jgi:hypothetical protein